MDELTERFDGYEAMQDHLIAMIQQDDQAVAQPEDDDNPVPDQAVVQPEDNNIPVPAPRARNAKNRAIENIAENCDILNKTNKEGYVTGQVDGAFTPESMSPESSFNENEAGRNVLPETLTGVKKSLEIASLRYGHIFDEYLVNSSRLSAGDAEIPIQRESMAIEKRKSKHVSEIVRLEVLESLANSVRLDDFMNEHEDVFSLEAENGISLDWHRRRAFSANSQSGSDRSGQWDHFPPCYAPSFQANRTLSLTTVHSPKNRNPSITFSDSSLFSD